MFWEKTRKKLRNWHPWVCFVVLCLHFRQGVIGLSSQPPNYYFHCVNVYNIYIFFHNYNFYNILSSSPHFKNFQTKGYNTFLNDILHLTLYVNLLEPTSGICCLLLHSWIEFSVFWTKRHLSWFIPCILGNIHSITSWEYLILWE